MAWCNRGTSLARLGRSEAALRAFDEAIGRAPKWSQPRVNKAVTLQELGRLEEAVDCLHELTRQAPELAEPWEHLANCVVQAGLPEDALAFYDRAIALAPALPSPWFGKGRALLNLDGRTEEAAACLHRFLEPDPGTPLKQAVVALLSGG